MRGEDFQFGQIESIRESALELMQFNNFPEALPDDAIVFTAHQGYVFGFIRASEGDNPPIHFYIEQGGWTRFDSMLGG
ncbi:hypothetical protein [Pantanalinema sp. GBBB05]|uniref:hypothetical protein n=1 Tax=Pantanalinema sp. GBBB05 TaxID=2604139 RepID=UPI001D26C876|nr:hypothetical protein [Pantanalinema sp. GBBB05]